MLNFEKGNGLIPAIIQDARTHEVLMLGYMNREAWTKTQKERRVWFYSRSKARLWMKGETSGCILSVKSIRADCDSDSLLIEVEASNDAVCHLGPISCFRGRPL